MIASCSSASDGLNAGWEPPSRSDLHGHADWRRIGQLGRSGTTQDPKRMTITMGEPGEEKDYRHYYTIEGDTLTTCHANKTFSNPFNIQLEPGAYFVVYTRVKE